VRRRGEREKEEAKRFSICYFPFSIFHFPFVIFHLSFSICHFPFVIFHLSFFISDTDPRLTPYGYRQVNDKWKMENEKFKWQIANSK